MIAYRMASSDKDFAAAQELFTAYAQWLNIDLSFQRFEDELSSLKSMYGPPLGCIFLVTENESYIGCTAVRPLADGACELKRMYVLPSHHRMGIGQALLQQALTFAKAAGYTKMRLDTLDTMTPAMQLYERNGFHRIEAYYHNPEKGAVYYECAL